MRLVCARPTAWLFALLLVGMSLVAAPASSNNTKGGPLHAQAVSIDVGNFFFSPDDVTIDAGDTVTWNWVGGTHNVQTSDGGETWCSTRSSGSCDKTFSTPGTYAYRCGIHPSSMQASITVAGEVPSVVIDAPSAGATIDGVVTVSGTASHSSGISSVSVRIDDDAIVPTTGTETWSASLDTTELTNGAHTISVHALTPGGVTGIASINVVVNNPAVIDLVALSLVTRDGDTGPARLTATILNDGNSAVVGSVVAFAYHNGDAWQAIGSVGLTLAAGAQGEAAISWTNTLAVGAFQVRAVADATNAIAEPNEGNNEVTGTVGFWTQLVPGIEIG